MIVFSRTDERLGEFALRPVDPAADAPLLHRWVTHPKSAFWMMSEASPWVGGGALILTSADRAKDFPQKPVYILGTGESVESPMISQMEDFTSSRAFRVAGKQAFDSAGIELIGDNAPSTGGGRGVRFKQPKPPGPA